LALLNENASEFSADKITLQTYAGPVVGGSPPGHATPYGPTVGGSPPGIQSGDADTANRTPGSTSEPAKNFLQIMVENLKSKLGKENEKLVLETYPGSDVTLVKVSKADHSVLYSFRKNHAQGFFLDEVQPFAGSTSVDCPSGKKYKPL
jgi:hypothetical protein